MLPMDAMRETYDEVKVLGYPMLFTFSRIDPTTVPKGLYVYNVRHADEDWSEPIEIARWVLVNHLGTLISKFPLALVEDDDGRNARLYLGEDDWVSEGNEITLEEFLNKGESVMARQEFESEIKTWKDLIWFCSTYDIDLCDTFVPADELQSEIGFYIMDVMQDWGWEHVRDSLNAIEPNHDCYRIEGALEFTPLTDEDFENTKREAIKCMYAKGLWNKESEENA